jgi:SAM-dependent methyltransferase
MQHLLGDDRLEQSPTVANSRMNRERGLAGRNSYARDLSLDPLKFLRARLESRAHVAWLDLCCGTGRALIEAARRLTAEGLDARVSLIGVDLVSMFDPSPAAQVCLHLCEASVTTWEPDRRFDLITCVHGLHYVGDKLRMLQRAASWLDVDGLLLAHLDFDNLRLANGQADRRVFRKVLREQGLVYRDHKHLLCCQGRRTLHLPYVYLGADDRAGPNYTGQDAVNSYYRLITSHQVGLNSLNSIAQESTEHAEESGRNLNRQGCPTGALPASDH